jgi:hypothetical protein
MGDPLSVSFVVLGIAFAALAYAAWRSTPAERRFDAAAYRAGALAGLAQAAHAAWWMLATLAVAAWTYGFSAVWCAVAGALGWALRGRMVRRLPRRVLRLVGAAAAPAVAWSVGAGAAELDVVAAERDAIAVLLALGSVLLAVLVAQAGVRGVVWVSTLVAALVLGVGGLVGFAALAFAGGIGGIELALASWEAGLDRWIPPAGNALPVASLALALLAANATQPFAMTLRGGGGSADWRRRLAVVLVAGLLAATALVTGWAVRALYGAPVAATAPSVFASANMFPPSMTAIAELALIAAAIVWLAGSMLYAASAPGGRSPQRAIWIFGAIVSIVAVGVLIAMRSVV